jgi:AcrR family transcriptional regulator
MTKRKPEEVRRKEILDAALRCFSNKGYHETRIDDIVKESGLTKGAIYWYFKGKRELFVALIEQHLKEDKALWKGKNFWRNMNSDQIF